MQHGYHCCLQELTVQAAYEAEKWRSMLKNAGIKWYWIYGEAFRRTNFLKKKKNWFKDDLFGVRKRM